MAKHAAFRERRRAFHHSAAEGQSGLRAWLPPSVIGLIGAGRWGRNYIRTSPNSKGCG